MTLEEQHNKLIKKWKALRTEMQHINYNTTSQTNIDMGFWFEAKFLQLELVSGRPVTEKSVNRLSTLIEEAHAQMFFDAIALGRKE